MRKIWNFAMAAIVIVASAGLFTACDKENSSIYSDYWDNTINGLSETEFSATEVMQSADYWFAAIKYYTEPEGKGQEYLGGEVSEDGLIIAPSGARIAVYAFGENQFRTYVQMDTGEPNIFVDYEMSDVNDNSFSVEYYGRPTYWKILGYDDNNIVVETDFFTNTNEGVEYPYSIVHFLKANVPDDYWAHDCISSEEYKEQRRQQQEDYWEAQTPEDIEMIIVHWLEKGTRTIEEIDEYFKYYCPEYYESTIKYILEKYK